MAIYSGDEIHGDEITSGPIPDDAVGEDTKKVNPWQELRVEPSLEEKAETETLALLQVGKSAWQKKWVESMLSEKGQPTDWGISQKTWKEKGKAASIYRSLDSLKTKLAEVNLIVCKQRFGDDGRERYQLLQAPLIRDWSVSAGLPLEEAEQLTSTQLAVVAQYLDAGKPLEEIREALTAQAEDDQRMAERAVPITPLQNQDEGDERAR